MGPILEREDDDGVLDEGRIAAPGPRRMFWSCGCGWWLVIWGVISRDLVRRN